MKMMLKKLKKKTLPLILEGVWESHVETQWALKSNSYFLVIQLLKKFEHNNEQNLTKIWI